MDNSNQNNNSNKAVALAGESQISQYFEAGSSSVFVLKKAEKLSSALYLITSFFDEKEPLRWKIRTRGAELVSAAVLLKDNEDVAIPTVKNLVFEIGSLLSVARNAGLISDANYSIVDKEFANLLEHLSPKVELSEGFFAMPEPDKRLPMVTDQRSFVGTEEPTIKVREDYKTFNFTSKPSSEPVVKGHKFDESSMTAGVSAKSGKGATEGVVSLKKNKRQSVILDLVKRKKEIMIKDVSPFISGCSEKTIQRELLALVKAGVLRKEGEKRWSRYSLA